MHQVFGRTASSTLPARGDVPPSRTLSFEQRLDQSARTELVERGVVRHFRTGEIAFLQGERAGRAAVVIDGVVKMTAASVDGRSTFLGLRREGDCVGLLEAMDGQPRTSTVTTIVPTSLRVIRLEEFRDVLADNESARAAAMTVVAERLRSIVDERLRSSGSSPTRLAACLLQLAAEHGHEGPDGSIAIEIPLTQADLALMIAASRDSVAKTLVTWRRQRIVATARRRLTIVDVERLLACCAP